MTLCIQSAMRRLSVKQLASYSTVTAKKVQTPQEPLEQFRTYENDPSKHTESHLHRFYTISPDHRKQLFQLGGIPKPLKIQMETFRENCLMIRQPAIEIMNYIKQADYSKPVNKYVLFGETGSGKSCTLAHLLHYGFVTNKLIVHVPWVLELFEYPKEFAPSKTRPNCWDIPVDAAAWLMNFKQQNFQLLKELKLTKDYTWGPQESSQAGSSYLELVEFGVSRIKYACDIIDAIMDEIKLASNAGLCKTLVVIDGFNGFYSDYTRIKNDLKKFVPTSQVTITESFLKITQSDWRNGAIVLTVDKRAQKDRRDSIYPHYLLSKEGFEHLDPFVPVKTENYNDEEYDNTMEYFKNRKWVREITPLGLQELRAICKSNPQKVREYCDGL